MKKCFFIASLMSLALMFISPVLHAQAIDVSGKWNMKVETGDRSGTPVFILKQSGETITGTYTGQLGEAPVKGTLKDKQIKLDFKVGEIDIVYTGTVDGNNMKGKATFGDLGEGTFSGVKDNK